MDCLIRAHKSVEDVVSLMKNEILEREIRELLVACSFSQYSLLYCN